MLFSINAAGVVPCGNRKTSPRTPIIANLYVCFGPLRSVGQLHVSSFIFEPRHAKTCLRGFRPVPTQTGLYSHIGCLET